MMHWIIRKAGEDVCTGNPGAFDVERNGGMTHELKLTNTEGNTVYLGVCTNPSLDIDPLAPQIWAGDGCVNTYFRVKGTMVWLGV